MCFDIGCTCQIRVVVCSQGKVKEFIYAVSPLHASSSVNLSGFIMVVICKEVEEVSWCEVHDLMAKVLRLLYTPSSHHLFSRRRGRGKWVIKALMADHLRNKLWISLSLWVTKLAKKCPEENLNHKWDGKKITDSIIKTCRILNIWNPTSFFKIILHI